MFTDIQLLSQTLLNGLFLSGIFIACSSGLSLAYGVLHIINVAYGEFMMLAAFSAYWMCVFTGLDPVFST
ncbi:MAG: branched-chain amino acid ABC transporter permease, partial [Candidatus Bathyarchaeia archaeon]